MKIMIFLDVNLISDVLLCSKLFFGDDSSADSCKLVVDESFSVVEFLPKQGVGILFHEFLLADIENHMGNSHLVEKKLKVNLSIGASTVLSMLWGLPSIMVSIALS